MEMTLLIKGCVTLSKKVPIFKRSIPEIKSFASLKMWGVVNTIEGFAQELDRDVDLILEGEVPFEFKVKEHIITGTLYRFNNKEIRVLLDEKSQQLTEEYQFSNYESEYEDRFPDLP